jgi:galactitol-specific phosphotransferase system IIB component
VNLSQIAGLAQRVPGMVYVGAFVAVFVASGAAAVLKHEKAVGAAEATQRIALVARKDSLKAVQAYAKELALADSIASAERNAAIIDAQAATVRRNKPSHQVAVTSDTSVTVVTADGADSSVTVAPQIVTALRDREAQIAADSRALHADSVKIETQTAKVAVDSAATALATRIEDSTPKVATDGGGLSVGGTAKVVVVAVAVVEGIRLVARFFHH